jgi:type IV pilus assembly protein PilA
MLRKLSARINSEESGFTLIELLVVILIIGILAAIALPNFLGQRSKAQDSGAKSDARNAVSQLESCYTDNNTYAATGTAAVTTTAPSCLPNNTGLSIGTGNGQVNVTAATTTGYTVVATSSNGHTFTITKDQTAGTITRSCTPTGQGGCPSTGNW